MAALLVLTILLFVSNMRTAHWTPLAVWLVVTLLVWQNAPLTGTSLNPARSLGHALAAWDFRDLWIYIIGPTLGAILATVGVVGGAHLRPATGKLFQDPKYGTIFMHEAAS